MKKAEKIIDVLGWIALFIFLGLGIYLAVKEQDVILGILVLVLVGTGIDVKIANTKFYNAIQDAKKKLKEIENV